MITHPDAPYAQALHPRAPVLAGEGIAPRKAPRPRSILKASGALLAGLGWMALAPVAHAVDTPAAPVADAAPPQADANGDASADANAGKGDIIVTGTHRTGVSAQQSSTPVTVVGNQQLSRSGVTTLTQALSIAAPSVDFAQNRSNIGATATKPVWLRGLSPDETLVLINGHRWYASANVNTGGGFGRGSQATDISAIPMPGVDHVEVLTDGASAQYGSDAVAGVVNIVMRKNPTGGDISVQGGIFTSGYGFTPQISGWKGFATPNGGSLTISGDWDHHNFVPAAAGYDSRCYYCVSATYPVANTAKEATANRNWYTGMGKGFDLDVAVDLEQPLTDELSFYGLFNYSRKSTDYVTSPRLPNQNTNVAALTPDGYTQLAVGKPTALAGMAGLKYAGDIGTFDLSLTYGRGAMDMYNNNSENPSYGTATLRNFYLGTITSEMVNAELSYTKPVDLGLASPVTVSAGVAQRWDSYTQKAGIPQSYSFGGVTGVPIGVTGGGYIVPDAAAYDRTRESTAAYLGVEGDLVRHLTLGLAGRYEHSNDFGNALTGKISGRYQVSPALSVRSSFNTAFKAPSIGQLSLYQDSPIQITPSAANPSGRVETLLVPSDSGIAQAAGGTKLKPEKSINASLGTVLTFNRNAYVTLDGYFLQIRDRIALSNLISGTQVNALLTAAGYPTVYGIQYFLNMGQTTTTGVDFSGHYDHPLGRGNLSTSLGVAYNRTTLQNITNATFSGTALVNYSTVTSLFYEATPKVKVIGNEAWTTDHWTLAGTQTFYSSYGGANTGYPGTSVYFNPSIILDFSVGYRLHSGWDITAGVQNATNYKPPYTPNSSNGGRMTTSNLALVNSGGAFTYLRLTKHL